MPLIRPSTFRSLQASLRHGSTRQTIRAAPGRTQFVARRYASSGAHGGHGEASSDIPWLAGAIAVTLPSMWYLWPDTSHAEHHGEHGGHEEHEEHAEGEDTAGEEKEGGETESQEDEAPQEDSAPAEKGDDSEEGGKSEDKSEEKSDDAEESEKSSKPSDSESASKSSTEEKEGGPKKQGNTKDVQFKGKMKEDSDGRSDERKTLPSPKGTTVKRIDSGLGKKLGEGSTYDDDDPKKESQSTSKEAGSSTGDITNKQKGLSTTDTKHSIQIDERDDKSTKGSGEPETAKAKGTVTSSGPLTGGPGQN